MTPEWWSQPFPPDGSTASDGIKRQLGTPTLDPLVVMLRESAQNSWDARLHEHGTIELDYRIERLGDWATVFRPMLLPGPDGDLEDLEASLDPNTVVLCVSDRATTGLGGPLRSDQVAPDGASADFVNFVRNAGEPRDRKYGGGTYGFGKGALFRISHPGVILVDTLCNTSSGPQRRLMGAALGHTFARDGKRYTGRHWWGILAEGVVDPAIGETADRIGAALSLRGFADGRTGTDIYIIAAALGETSGGEPRTRRAAGEVLASAGLWYLWPKLLHDRGVGGIDLTVHVDGERLPLPDPRTTGRLRCFTDALDRLDAGKGEEKTRRAAPHSVGFFAAGKDLWIPATNPIVDAAAPFDGPAHHCARMRHLELVVDYLAGDELADPDEQYGAVFRATEDPQTEAAFAAAEPPTHDDWHTQHLTGIQKGIVRDARSFVRDRMAALANPAGLQPGTGSNVPLASLSRSLAGILPSGGGDGADTRPGPRPTGGGNGGGTSTRARADGLPRLVVRDGEAVIAQPVVLSPSTDPVSATLRADVAVDGGRERTAPVGARSPLILGWQADDGTWIDGPEITVEAEGPRNWTAFVRPAPDTSTVVRVTETRA